MVPLTSLIYGILGLAFINHQKEGFNWVSRTKLYAAIKVLADHHSQYFFGVYFTKRGNLEHSKQVEDVLFRLAGVLTTQDLGGQRISFEEKQLTYVHTKLIHWLEAADLVAVKKMADEFYQLIKG